MSCHAVHKRSACDRCRDQKLRCLRADNNVDESCQRCRRAGALCVTGGTRPLGRPRTNNASGLTSRLTTGQGHFRRRQRDSSVAPSSSTSCSPSPSISTHHQHPPPAGAVEATAMLPWANDSSLAMNDYAAMSMESLLQLPSPESSSASNPTQESLDSMEQFFGMVLPDGGFGEMMTLTPQTDGSNFPTDLEMEHPVNGALPENKAQPGDAQRDGTTLGLGTSSNQEVLISLSRLNESVSQQLAKIDSYPWRTPPAMQRLCSSKINSTTDNPVAETLQITTRFAALLKTLGARGNATTSSSLGAATYLLLLSSYLQIIQLYDAIFRRIAEFLDHDDATREAGAGTGTGTADLELQHDFRVAGLTSMPPQLYLRLLVQILDHQLEAIECLVGLPADCCVSGRAPTRRGIFSDEDVSMLLETVMGKTNDGGGAFKGRSTVLSLRENMTAVKEFLRG